jgi:hypothetical protein
MRYLPIFAFALITAGCGGGPENHAAQTPAGNRVTGNTEAARLTTLSAGQRNAVFIRAIRDAGLECQHVDWSELTGRYRGLPVWTASCSRNQVWAIVVGENGIAQILNPTEALIVYDRMGEGNQAAGR